VSEQLSLGIDAATVRLRTCCASAPGAPHGEGCTNPNLAFFNDDGSPRRLLWCSDSARLGGPCPYTEPRVSRADGSLLPPIGLALMPAGGCCKDIVSRG
jgi:hypothetical protein